ncbi:hypothetical protein KJ863_04870 [Patescibacteria group bacterium]|nr:hypothetical protein [Patescibacteria group bacterium]MCG2701093.1 hypothetical protein [Candidatus Parcubacteria bacterium]
MTIITKKLLLQTFLLLTTVVIVWISAFNIDSQNIFLSVSTDSSLLFTYFHLILFVFTPVTALYFIRRKDSKILGKLFRATAYLSVFVVLLLFLINLIPPIESINTMIIDSEENYLSNELFVGLWVSLAYFLLAILIYIAARINKSLDGEKFSMIPMTENIKFFLVLFSILTVLAMSFYLWYKASRLIYIVEISDTWYANQELSRIAVKDIYDLTLEKITILSGWIFISTFLLIKVLPDKKYKI